MYPLSARKTDRSCGGVFGNTRRIVREVPGPATAGDGAQVVADVLAATEHADEQVQLAGRRRAEHPSRRTLTEYVGMVRDAPTPSRRAARGEVMGPYARGNRSPEEGLAGSRVG